MREFLQRFWQRAPLLVRSAVADTTALPGRKALMGLATRDDVESRLVLERGGDYPWQVVHGPFTRRRLRALPRRHWSLLVQGVNFHDDGVAALLGLFAFLPAWRIDDAMLSIAPDGGGVGPHVDSYDVFLLQVHGARRWRIGRTTGAEAELEPGTDLRILRRFHADHDCLLAPGDMLYLPPGVAHHGTAAGESVTCSIGFRAPSRLELLGALLDEGDAVDERYADAGAALQRSPGEITATSLRALRRLMTGTAADEDTFAPFFGRYITALPAGTRAPRDAHALPAAALMVAFRRHGVLIRDRACRCAWTGGRGGRPLQLFANGVMYPLPASAGAVARQICDAGRIDHATVAAAEERAAVRTFIHRLYREGVLRLPG